MCAQLLIEVCPLLTALSLPLRRRDLSSQVALFRQSHEAASQQMSELQALVAELKNKFKAKGAEKEDGAP